MNIIYEMFENTLTAQMIGELDHLSAEKVRNEIDETMGRYDAENLILDFSRVTFMDSAGIGVVLGRYKKHQKGKLVITGCSQKIRKILEMAGVFSLMKYTDKKEEAMEWLRGQEA